MTTTEDLEQTPSMQAEVTCCPAHAWCTLGCWTEADEED